MKQLKQELMRIILILIVQVLISFLAAYIGDIKWSLKGLVCNYVFVIFWISYIVSILSIGIIKKLKKQNPSLQK